MKHKIIGTIVWLGLAVIILPFFLDGAGVPNIQPQETVHIDSPAPLSQPLSLEPVDSVDYQAANTVTATQQSTNIANSTTNDTATITLNTNTTNEQTSTAQTLENNQTASTSTVKPTPKSVIEEPAKATKTTATATNTKPSSKEPTKISDVITKGYAVQLASFKNKPNAVALKDKLIKAKYDAFLLNKGEFTQVLVGPTFERLQSQKLLEKLKTEFKLTGFVVTYTKAD